MYIHLIEQEIKICAPHFSYGGFILLLQTPLQNGINTYQGQSHEQEQEFSSSLPTCGANGNQEIGADRIYTNGMFMGISWAIFGYFLHMFDTLYPFIPFRNKLL